MPSKGPEFAQRVAAIAASEGVTSLDPGVVELLCDAAHSHATQTLQAGVRAAFHANRSTPNAGDLQVGVHTLKRRSPAPPSIVNAAEAARERNSTPLPRLEFGVRLPPDSALAQPPGTIKDATDPNALDRLSHGTPPWNSAALPPEYMEMLKREKENAQVEEAKKAKPKEEAIPEKPSIVKTEMELATAVPLDSAAEPATASNTAPVAKQEP